MTRKKVNRKDKKCYLEHVWLSTSEHAHLLEMFGAEELHHWIVELNGYVGSKGKDPYESHYYTIQNWARRAKSAAIQNSKLNIESSTLNSARRAVDRVMELLKTPGAYMPTEENIRPVLHAFLVERKQNWPQLRAFLIEHPEEEARIREELIAAFRISNCGLRNERI